jgi:sugar-specific transcriptional regulator TrmB
MLYLSHKYYMDLQNSLQNLGLNNREIAIYIALLKLGRSQAGPIIKETGLHRMQVYESLEELKNKGLVLIGQEKTVQFFEAANPNNLIEIQKQKLDIANATAKTLLEIQKHSPLLEIKQYKGSEGLFTNLMAFIHATADSKDKTLRMIGGASDTDFYQALGNNYKHYVALAEQYKIKKRLLGPAEQINITKSHYKQETNAEAKVLPPSFNHPVYTRICESMVSLEFYKPEVTIIQISNKDIAASYIANFDLIWNSI